VTRPFHNVKALIPNPDTMGVVFVFDEKHTNVSVFHDRVSAWAFVVKKHGTWSTNGTLTF